MGIMGEGIKLMVMGMGMVSLFLILMVIVISVVAKLLAPFAGILEEPAKPAKKKKRVTVGKEDNAIIAAIISAVHQYRQDKLK